MIFSIWGSSEAELSGTLFKVAFQIDLFLTLLLFEMAVLCNLFCAAGGSAIGILLSMLCVIGLIMWSTAEVDGVVSEMINPMWLSAETLENITKQIGKPTVLTDICLTMKCGQICGITGENGSGKTMLMRVIAGLVSPSTGKLLFGGKNRAYANCF